MELTRLGRQLAIQQVVEGEVDLTAPTQCDRDNGPGQSLVGLAKFSVWARTMTGVQQPIEVAAIVNNSGQQ